MDGVFNMTKLLKDLSTWMIGLVPACGALMIGYHAILKSTATDDHSAAQHSRGIRNVLFGIALGTGAAALVSFLSGYVGK